MQRLSPVGSYTLLLISSLTIMVGCVLAPGLTSISTQMDVADKATWLITFPSLGAVVFAPLAGRIIDNVGAYKSMLVGLFLYGLIGASGLFFHGDYSVFINRFLLGAITAVVMASGTVLISEWFHGEARLKMIAKQGMSIELGGVIFLFIGGVLAEMGWQWPFILYLLAWIFLSMLYLYVPAKSPQIKQQENNIADETTKASPVKIIYFTAGASMVIFFTIFVTLPILLSTLDFNESQIGAFLSFISFMAVFTVLVMPKLLSRIGNNGTLIAAFFCYSLSHISFFFANDLLTLLVGGIFAGIGFGLSIPLLNHMTIEQSSPSNRGKNLSYITMAIFSGQFVTSFLEFIPGNSQPVFAVATVFSLFYALYLIISHTRNNNPTSTVQVEGY